MSDWALKDTRYDIGEYIKKYRDQFDEEIGVSLDAEGIVGVLINYRIDMKRLQNIVNDLKAGRLGYAKAIEYIEAIVGDE